MKDSRFIREGYYTLGNIVVCMVSEACMSTVLERDIIYGDVFTLNTKHLAKPLKGQAWALEKGTIYRPEPIPLCPEFFDEQALFTRVPQMAYLLGVDAWCNYVLRVKGKVEPTGNLWHVGRDKEQSAVPLATNLFIVEVMINTSLTNPTPYYFPVVFKNQICVSCMRPLEYVHELQQVLDLFHVHGISHCEELCDERDRLYFQYVAPPTIQFTFNYLKSKNICATK